MRAFVSLRAGDLFEFAKGAPPPDPEDPLSRASIEALEISLKGAGGKLRFVRGESRHLTLRFLGEIEPSAARGVSEALERAVRGFGPFPVGPLGVGFFPNAVRPKVVWVGVDDPDRQVAPLYAAVEAALKPAGFEGSGDTFVPHITVARVTEVPPGQALAQAVDPYVHTRFGWAQATGLDFFESSLKKGGAVYRLISKHAFPARGV